MRHARDVGEYYVFNYVNTRLYEFHYDIYVNGFGKSRQLYTKIIYIGVGGGVEP